MYAADSQGGSNKRSTSSGNNGGRKKFMGKCHHCGKTSHLERDCWDKPENAHKVPNWVKKLRERQNNCNEEQGNAAVDHGGSGSGNEFVMSFLITSCTVTSSFRSKILQRRASTAVF